MYVYLVLLYLALSSIFVAMAWTTSNQKPTWPVLVFALIVAAGLTKLAQIFYQEK